MARNSSMKPLAAKTGVGVAKEGQEEGVVRLTRKESKRED